jgi:hypothetical protein
MGNDRNHNFRTGREALESRVTWILRKKVVALTNDTLANLESGH